MTAPPSPLLLTLGHGGRSIDEVIALLRAHDVRFLVDVRSAPYSRYQPDFSHGALKEHLEAHGLVYLYMGQELGGRPDDPACYVDGKVVYGRLRERPEFEAGIGRLQNAWNGGHRVALLCSEARPENCHRSKAIGPSLRAAGITVLHLDEHGTPLSQEEVDLRREGGQMGLFEDLPSAKASASHKRYEPAEE